MPATELSARELDAAIARVLGLPVVWSTPPYRKEVMGLDPNAKHPFLKGVTDGVEYDWASVPRYSSDLNAAHELGAAAVRLGIANAYLVATQNIVAREYHGIQFEFALMNATADERARAFYAACKEKGLINDGQEG